MLQWLSQYTPDKQVATSEHGTAATSASHVRARNFLHPQTPGRMESNGDPKTSDSIRQNRFQRQSETAADSGCIGVNVAAGCRYGRLRRAERRNVSRGIKGEIVRQSVRNTAAKVLRSEDLAANEKEQAASILRENPSFGNPHAVRCDWCRESRTLFRDENDGPFELITHGWRCTSCNVTAASQEIRF